MISRRSLDSCTTHGSIDCMDMGPAWGNIALVTTQDIRDIVDGLISVRKEISDFSSWQPSEADGKRRSVTPVILDGEIVGTLELQAYPNEPQPAYRILLNCFGRCVSRLDCRDLDGPHYNSSDRPSGLSSGPIFGQHMHYWNDNRRFSKLGSLSDKLPNARELEPTIKSFDFSLRWFCGECNIDISGLTLPDLPPRERLL